MGRPREHDQATAQALLAAAERTVTREGSDAMSLRELARDAGTTTRAVYSLFGSREGLLVALGARAFELLREGLDALPVTDDPREDLVAAGLMFRRFAVEHPALFAIGVQRTLSQPSLWPEFQPTAKAALGVLQRRVARLHQTGELGGRSVIEATFEFHALCEGLAAVELRGTYPGADPERLWRDALRALVIGFRAAPDPRR